MWWIAVILNSKMQRVLEYHRRRATPPTGTPYNRVSPNPARREERGSPDRSVGVWEFRRKKEPKQERNWFMNASGVEFVVLGALALIGTVVAVVVIITALVKLKEKPIDEISRVLWAWLILILPVVGAIAFFIVSPGKQIRKTEQ